MSPAEEFFELVCNKPSMFGPPIQVEAHLWAAMFIWSFENLPRDDEKNHVHRAVMEQRKKVPGLTDRAGLSFHDLCENKLHYTPIIGPMMAAFRALKEQAEDL
jgi:hypothetical protein